MIIDLILDRELGEKHGERYNPHKFYRECMEYNSIFSGIADGITRAMDFGEETDVRRELCNYVTGNGYSPSICDYINSREWLN